MDAQVVAQEWMRYFGYIDARVGPDGPDGGVDVDSSVAVAQVKAEMRPTGRPVVQHIFGVAAHEGKSALVFSLAGYTDDAVDWATEAGVALFRFDLSGEPEPVTGAAKDMFARAGGGPDPWDSLLERCRRFQVEAMVAGVKGAGTRHDGLGMEWRVAFGDRAITISATMTSQRLREAEAAQMAFAQQQAGSVLDLLLGRSTPASRGKSRQGDETRRRAIVEEAVLAAEALPFRSVEKSYTSIEEAIDGLRVVVDSARMSLFDFEVKAYGLGPAAPPPPPPPD